MCRWAGQAGGSDNGIIGKHEPDRFPIAYRLYAPYDPGCRNHYRLQVSPQVISHVGELFLTSRGEMTARRCKHWKKFETF